MCLAHPAGSLLAWGASWALCLSGGQCRAGGHWVSPRGVLCWSGAGLHPVCGQEGPRSGCEWRASSTSVEHESMLETHGPEGALSVCGL